MIVITGLTKQFNQELVLSDINLELKPATISVLVGKNGAGKTTFMKCLLGLLEFDGEIQVDGLSHRSIAAKENLGFIPDSPMLYENLTIEEHLDFVKRMCKDNSHSSLAYKYLEIFNLSEKKKVLIKNLSKGMRQKVSIILSLIGSPKYLIIDEPLEGLDPFSIQDFIELIILLKNRGIGILLSTHLIDIFIEICDEVIILEDTKIVDVLEATTTLNSHVILEKFKNKGEKCND